MNDARWRAGCFGKVRSYGDFVTLRMPPGFVAPWDAMLQAGMLASRAAHGDDWMSIYLRAPLWYFVLGPDVVDSNVWAGVLMPSVDRVGRHFPLTIAAAPAAPAAPAGAAAMAEVGGKIDYGWLIDARSWFERCAELALATLSATAMLADLEHGLATLGAIAPGREAAQADRNATWPRSEVHHAAWPLNSCARSASLWWSDGSDMIMPCVRRCQGLPSAHQLRGLFDGDTAGWSECSTPPDGAAL